MTLSHELMIKEWMRGLAGIRDYLLARSRSGEKNIDCPVCGRSMKQYRRRLHATMAVFMIELYHQACQGNTWVDVRDLPSYRRGQQRGDYAYLVHWGLVATKPNDDPKRRSSGMWSLTRDGRDFVLGRHRVPSHVLILCGENYGLTGTTITIRDALGKGFDYEELMNA